MNNLGQLFSHYLLIAILIHFLLSSEMQGFNFVCLFVLLFTQRGYQHLCLQTHIYTWNEILTLFKLLSKISDIWIDRYMYILRNKSDVINLCEYRQKCTHIFIR